jgi:hypothetical protein
VVHIITHILGGTLSPFPLVLETLSKKFPQLSLVCWSPFYSWGGVGLSRDVVLCIYLPLLFPIDVIPSCTHPRTHSGCPPLLILGFSMIAIASGLVMHGIILILHFKAVSRTLPLNSQFPSTCFSWFTNTTSPCSQVLRF